MMRQVLGTCAGMLVVVLGAACGGGGSSSTGGMTGSSSSAQCIDEADTDLLHYTRTSGDCAEISDAQTAADYGGEIQDGNGCNIGMPDASCKSTIDCTWPDGATARHAVYHWDESKRPVTGTLTLTVTGTGACTATYGIAVTQ